MSPLNRSAQARMGREEQGASPSGPGSHPSDQSAPRTGGKPFRSHRASKLDTVMLKNEYLAAYDAANKYGPPFRIEYEGGWFVFKSRHSSMVLQNARASKLIEMTEILRARVASAGEAGTAETGTGSVHEHAAPPGETPSQSPDPLSQTVAPSPAPRGEGTV